MKEYLHRPAVVMVLVAAVVAPGALRPAAVAGVTVPKPGTKCSPAGRTVTVKNLRYRCVRVSGKLVWSKPVKVTPKPSVTPTTPAPQVVPTPIPTIAPTALPVPPQAVSAARYAFQATNDAGKPVHWDRCRPITWTYFPESSKPFALGVVQTALQRLANATGFTFTYVAPGSAPEPKWATISNPNAPVSPAQLQILFGDSTNIPSLTAESWGNTALYWNGSGIAQIAYVVVRPDIKYGPDDFGYLGMGLVFMHELAHAVGLDHVSSTQDLMFPNLASIEVRGYAAGDLAGLYAVSAALPCA